MPKQLTERREALTCNKEYSFLLTQTLSTWQQQKVLEQQQPQNTSGVATATQLGPKML